MIRNLSDVKKRYYRLIMNSSKSLVLLKKEHFDVALGEIFESCGYIVFELLGIKKYITTYSSSLSVILDRHSGVPQAQSILPPVFGTSTDKMNFFQRMRNFLTMIFEEY